MTLKDGKFYDNLQNRVPMEHGNQDQFKLLEKAAALNSDDGIIVAGGSFVCLCGERIQWRDRKDKFKCPGCSLSFVFFYFPVDYLQPGIPCVRIA